jgi:hypothetical protein
MWPDGVAAVGFCTVFFFLFLHFFIFSGLAAPILLIAQENMRRHI